MRGAGGLRNQKRWRRKSTCSGKQMKEDSKQEREDQRREKSREHGPRPVRLV